MRYKRARDSAVMNQRLCISFVRALVIFALGMLCASFIDLASKLEHGYSSVSVELDVELPWLHASSSSSSNQSVSFASFSSPATGSDPSQTDDDDESSDTPFSRGLCSLLPHPTPSAISLWSSHLSHVFESTRHPIDRAYEMHDLTALLLHYMHPGRLQRSARTTPRDWHDVARVLDVGWRRWRFLKQRGTQGQGQGQGRQQGGKEGAATWGRTGDGRPPPRKVNILVMGGSVTLGVNCPNNPVVRTRKYTRRACAWPFRLERFLNTFLAAIGRDAGAAAGGAAGDVTDTDIVSVTNVALGGTNTESGVIMWEYGLLPEGTPYPDIVINAYSTNDMHINSIRDAESRNRTLADNVFDVTQRFVRAVLRPEETEPKRRSNGNGNGNGNGRCDTIPRRRQRQRRRQKPLLIYFDDYIGNEQNSILETTAVSSALNVLSSYYGFAHVSYADAVRDVVYGDTSEEWFSPNGWYDGKGRGGGGNGGGGKGTWTRQVHPGMSMHIASTWVMAFNLLNMATSYCGLDPSMRRQLSQYGGYVDAGDGDVHDFENMRSNTTNDAAQLSKIKQRKEVKENNERDDVEPTWERLNHGYRPVGGLPPLRGNITERRGQREGEDEITSVVRGGPKLAPAYLPPVLDESLELEAVSRRWKEDDDAAAAAAASSLYLSSPVANATAMDCNDDDDDDDDGEGLSLQPAKPCVFAWVAGISKECDTKDCLNETWTKKYLITNDGWAFDDDSNKLGFVAAGGTRSKFILVLERLARSVRNVTFMVMRSYGDRWDGSMIKAEVYAVAEARDGDGGGGSEWKGGGGRRHDQSTTTTMILEERRLNGMEIPGFHDKQTSEIYNYKLDLRTATDGAATANGGASVGETLKLVVELVSGSTFKITGLAFCDR